MDRKETTVRYPTPPADRPINTGNTTAAGVLRACDLVSRGMGFSNACALAGINRSRADWARFGEHDVFWEWALSCMELAEAGFVGNVELALGEIAYTKDEEGRLHKDALRAQQTILKRRSEMYAEEAQRRETTGLSITIDKIQLLLSGATGAPAAVVGAAFPSLSDTSVIEGEVDEDTDDGALPAHVTMPERDFAFKRKAVER